jgi:hypothetical protein
MTNVNVPLKVIRKKIFVAVLATDENSRIRIRIRIR